MTDEAQMLRDFKQWMDFYSPGWMHHFTPGDIEPMRKCWFAATEKAQRPEERPTRTKAQCLAAVVAELNLDMTDPFTRILAAAFALQDAYDESRAALARCQQIVHDQAAPSPLDAQFKEKP